MDQSLQQSFFGRPKGQKRANKKKLIKILKSQIWRILQFCRRQSKRIKRRDEYQHILFPQDYKQQQSQQVSTNLRKQYRKLCQYPFYLTRCELFIDNFHVKIARKTEAIPFDIKMLGFGEIRQFGRWVSNPSNQHLIIITSQNVVLLIYLTQKLFLKYQIENKKNEPTPQIISVNGYKNYLFIFYQSQCHICQINKGKDGFPKIQKLAVKYLTDGILGKGIGIEKERKFYLFFIVQTNLYLQKIDLGIIMSKLDSKHKSLFHSGMKLINFQLSFFPNGSSTEKVFLAIRSKEYFKIMSLILDNEHPELILQKQNPISPSQKNSCQQIAYLQFIQRKKYLLCIYAFRQRLYFTRIWDDYCQHSKRVKFQQPVWHVSTFGRQNGLIILTRHIKDATVIWKCYITKQDHITSYKQYVYTELVIKYQLNFETQINNNPFNNQIYVYNNRQVLLIGKDKLERIVLSSWKDIYNDMKVTENIKLLKYLILLKYSDSIFLDRPRSFQGLQSFFEITCDESRQILIEYYYIMNMQPLLLKVTDHYQLMIPFIIEHQLNNLSQENLEVLLIKSLTYDERLVQELIIGGSNHGWEIAVKKGWIRAFKAMVERGMELQMPILKLYSMAIFQKRAERISEDSQQIQYLTPQGQQYLNQLIDYILFVLVQFFKTLSGDGSNQQFKNIITIILKDDFWTFMIKFAPSNSIEILSIIFSTEQKINQVDKYNPILFLDFNKKYPFMVINSPSNSRAVVSHISAEYYEIYQQENMNYLIIEHGKLLLLNFMQYLKHNSDSEDNFRKMIITYDIFENQPYYEDNFQTQFYNLRYKLQIKTFFMFKKDYLSQILKLFTKDQYKILQQVYLKMISASQKSYKTYNQRYSQMIDFLIYIWQIVYYNIIIQIMQQRRCDDEKFGAEQCDIRIKTQIRKKIKLILSDIEENIYQDQYLSIHMMLAVNNDGDFTLKIFNKFLACKNQIIKERIFIWLRNALPKSTILQEELIKKLKEIIAINNEEPRAILENYYQGKEKQIIQKIDNDPFLQLEYLQLIIKNTNQELERYYTNLHIELILKLKPNSLIKILQTNNELVEYDISEALRMTLQIEDFQQKNNILIYLYQRQGQLMKCIIAYLSAFDQLVFRYITLCQETHKQQQDELANFSLTGTIMITSQMNNQLSTLMQQINIKYKDSVKLLFRIPQLHYEHVSKYLRKFISILKLIHTRTYKFKQSYLQYMIQFLGKFIIELFQRNCLDFLSLWISQVRSDLLQLLILVNDHFIQGYDQMLVQLVILKSMSNMEKKILIKEIIRSLRILEFCISSEAYCRVCNRQFEDDYQNIEGLLFNCGHLYHRSCIDQVNGEDFCYYCVSKNQYISMIENQSLNLVQLLAKYRQKRRQKKSEDYVRVQGKKKDGLITLSKKRTNRLALYDKKMTAIQNQAQIIDLKLLIQDYYNSQCVK